MICFSVLFHSLTLPFPGGYIGHSMDVSYAAQNGGLISFLGMSRSDSQPELLSYSMAITRSLAVTLHNCSHSLPLIHSAIPVFHKLISPHHCIQLHCTCTSKHIISRCWRHCANFISSMASSCSSHF